MAGLVNHMQTFYLTFGQNNSAFRNGWIEVEAENYEKAHELVIDRFSTKWSSLYNIDEFDPSFFPFGKIGETLR